MRSKFWVILKAVKATLLGAVFLVFNHTNAHSDDDCLKIGFSANALLADAQKHVLQTVYKHAGLCIKALDVPINRSGFLLMNNLLDGDAFEIEAEIENQDSILIVPEPLLVDEGVLAVRAGNPMALSSLGEAEQKPIAVKLGAAWAQAAAEASGAMVSEVSKRSQLFDMLFQERVEGVLLRRLHIELFSGLRGLDRTQIEVVEVVQPVVFFHALHKRHAQLVDRISTSIRELREMGKIPKSPSEWATLARELSHGR